MTRLQVTRGSPVGLRSVTRDSLGVEGTIMVVFPLGFVLMFVKFRLCGVCDAEFDMVQFVKPSRACLNSQTCVKFGQHCVCGA